MNKERQKRHQNQLFSCENYDVSKIEGNPHK